MSHIAKFATQLREAEHLVAALKQMGYPNAQLHTTPTALQMYAYSDRPLADISVPKSDLMAKHGHCFGQLGFARQADGTFALIADDLDQPKMNKQTRGKNWLDSVSNHYAEQDKMAWALQNGFIFQDREELEMPDGTVEVELHFVER